MSEHLHPGVHPDADTLSAFVEGVLPEHERVQCLAHLAECSRCREVVFLAQDTPELVLVSAPARQRWLKPMPVLAAAAAVCVAAIASWLYLRSRTGAPPRELVAQVTQAPSSTPENPVETPASKPVAPKAIHPTPRRRSPEHKADEPSPTPVTMPEVAPTATPPAAAESASLGAPLVNIPSPPKFPPIVVPTEGASAEALSAISGTVTDSSGAVVSQANIQLRQIAVNSTINVRSDQEGQFKFSGLAPGQYELEITAPGFQRSSQRVELKPQEVADVKSQLQIGSTAETVEVTAVPSTLQTSSAQMSTRSQKREAPARPLPSKLPVETTVTRDKVMLVVDSAGALFYSGNSGKSWKAVKPQWSGKIVDLVAPPEVQDAGSAQFQLTTDSDADWLSRDGRHWYPAPPQQ
jgi:hypothetical protein